jgi:hypothetical protein
MSRREPVPRAAVFCALLAAVLLAALGLSRGTAFWSVSDGVYALTARLFGDGAGLYTDMATAQPPPLYLFGAGALAIDDSLTALRAALEAVGLATALLVFAAVWRLTGRAWLAAVAGVLAPLTPVMLHENALLTPETLGAPLLLGVALLARRPAAAGALGAVAVAVKLSFALPVVLVLLVLPGRVRALAALAAAGAALAAVATLLWGGDLWSGILVAQSQSGWTDGGDLPGLLAQEAWNVGPLAVAAAGGLLTMRGDDVLARALAAAALGGLALGLTVLKQGTYVNAIQVAEPPLLVLAACAVAWARGRWRPLLAAAGALLALQSASLLVSPGDPWAHTRPFADAGPRRLLSEAEVARFAAAARACPADAPYPGIPFVAFVAGRRPPADQPDPFVLGAEENERFRARYDAALASACPRDAPTGDGP